VLTEALPLSAAGALYPVAFAAIVAVLGGRNPLHRALAFLGGGAIVSLIGYVVVIELIRLVDFTPGKHPAIAASVKLLLGVALLIYAGHTVLRRRRQGPAEVIEARDEAPPVAGPDGEPEPAVQEPSLRRAFISGMVIYFPGVFLVASANAIAAARASTLANAVAIVVCTILLLLIIEVPIAAYAVAPGRVGPPLVRITNLGKLYSKQLILAAALVAGLYLLIAGILALT
jgi:hypothetical protein